MSGADFLLLAGAETESASTPVGSSVVGELATSGPIFTLNGQPWRWKGVTAFQLLDKFAKHQDIDPFLQAYRGFTVLRVFLYTPAKDWGAFAWEPPPPATILEFLAYVGARGWFVELVLLTDDDVRRVAAVEMLVDVLSAARPQNLVLEAGNEPTTHKNIPTVALRSTLDLSGFLYSSGDYEDSSRWFGRFLTAHTGRDDEWPRRAHDLLEYYAGGGPNAPSDPAHKVPIVADEPIRPDQAFGNRAQDFRAYFGTCALLGAGATFHSETGKYGLLPSPDEDALAREALWALDAFPPDAPLGGYRRPVERSLRTYVVGRYMVRIRPEVPYAPEAGWLPIDNAGILWKR